MGESMVERVARAMFERDTAEAHRERFQWKYCHEADRAEYLADARAALAALGFTEEDLELLGGVAFVLRDLIAHGVIDMKDEGRIDNLGERIRSILDASKGETP